MLPTWLLGIFAGWTRIDWQRLAIAAVAAAGIILVFTIVNRLVDGAVADWRAAQEREKAELVERVAQGAAIARKRYEDDLGEKSERIADLERELEKLMKDGDPVAFPRGLARSLNK